eukprot:CAMPEP_0204411960 /NCGR_PEP_ID=MMETSP0470-20130426/11715_1 /ASSEMBLY_ACC=CAM_ASM_000385 /TAXON_ID=2969 /ORGANISM="Oxyrrhis marina" /LENGTH=39 /DNA_ID= /DNA_START= /DNA_END= /DNA_ORIENTATION=
MFLRGITVLYSRELRSKMNPSARQFSITSVKLSVADSHR